jgi:hypothetical protein
MSATLRIYERSRFLATAHWASVNKKNIKKEFDMVAAIAIHRLIYSAIEVSKRCGRFHCMKVSKKNGVENRGKASCAADRL